LNAICHAFIIAFIRVSTYFIQFMSFPKENLRRILFLDIETATIVEHFSDLTPIFKEFWRTRSDRFLEAYNAPLTEDDISAYYNDKAAIYSEYSRVICISLGYLTNDEDEASFRVKSIYGTDERDVLGQFSELLSQHYYDPFSSFLCGHNIKEFDIPFLCRRYIINGLKLPNLLNISGLKPWQVHHLIDTLELWKFGDYKHYSSLDLLCATLGIESPKGEMSGKDVNGAFWEGRLDEIVYYCEKDVVATARVYLRCIEKVPFSYEKIVRSSDNSAKE
jgi:3'-5' exonuclease